MGGFSKSAFLTSAFSVFAFWFDKDTTPDGDPLKKVRRVTLALELRKAVTLSEITA